MNLRDESRGLLNGREEQHRDLQACSQSKAEKLI